MMLSFAVGARCQCFFSVSCSASLEKSKRTQLHLKIWTLLVRLFDLIAALPEGFFFQIGGVYLFRGHSIDIVIVFAIQHELLHLVNG